MDLLSRFTGQGFDGLVSPAVTFILFLIFVIVMVILFSNLLVCSLWSKWDLNKFMSFMQIGLAVGDVQDIYSNAELETILIQVMSISLRYACTCLAICFYVPIRLIWFWILKLPCGCVIRLVNRMKRYLIQLLYCVCARRIQTIAVL